eukprot:344349_1
MNANNYGTNNENDEKNALIKKASTNKCSFILLSMLIAVISFGVTILLTSQYCNYSSNDNNIYNIQQEYKNEYDIIIVGAGPAGLVQMYFLEKYYPNLNILLIEQLNRIGGRTFTANIKYKNKTIHFENGALRTSFDEEYIMKMLYYLDLCQQIVPFNNPNCIRYKLQPTYQIRRYQYNNSYENLSNYLNKVYNFNKIEKNVISTSNNKDLIKFMYDYGWNYIHKKKIINDQYNDYTFNGQSLWKWSISDLFRILNFSLESLDYIRVMSPLQILPPNTIVQYSSYL